ncbi:MAG: hypothetical protein COB20_06405 [SAR86 cluster bacterium]|uniref:DUF998 domain-containing protein n=1 Tax=SAR86 cluster bacterium TaxID=2030880 RepID=A0A2A4X8I9_9GAMM|nr:MAG: hypothetical protein COB20_06405 [SAR86 cluster bacterium]
MSKYLDYAGIFAAPWFLVTLGVFAYLEPNYSHLYKAVSELGAFGASNWILMNVFCFFTTGLLVIMAGLAFRKKSKAANASLQASFWVVLMGVMFAGTAIPADMELYFNSPWTVAHAFFSTFGIIPFLVAAWKTPKALKEIGIESNFVSYFPLVFIPTFLMHGLVQQGGLVQRATILVLLIWVSYLNWVLLSRLNSHENKIIRGQG